MKRYSCYYKNDFGDAYPALSDLDDNGEWADFEEAAQDIKGLRDELTAAQVDRDTWRRSAELLHARSMMLAALLYPRELRPAVAGDIGWPMCGCKAECMGPDHTSLICQAECDQHPTGDGALHNTK